MGRCRQHQQLRAFSAGQQEHQDERHGQGQRSQQQVGAEAAQAGPRPVGQGADQGVDDGVPDERAHVDEARRVGG
ncbi:hypothetical protein A7R81_19270 [Pseudomonas aeruginosa]|nr:hypothetical protein A7R81_19270 [Pseudomonas aeruginosa]